MYLGIVKKYQRSILTARGSKRGFKGNQGLKDHPLDLGGVVNAVN